MKKHEDCESGCLIAEARGPACECQNECAYAIITEAKAAPIKESVQIESHGITVNCGSDGTWVCFKTSNGREFCFQPIQEWPANSHWHTTIKQWCLDMQKIRDEREEPK